MQRENSLATNARVQILAWVISTPKPGGASTESLCVFIAIINTFKSLFKASDTFNVFQVLIKMADSHRNCQHH